MDLGNASDVTMHYPLIEGITYLGCLDGFPMVNALICMVTHWIRPMVSHDIGYREVMISPS